MRATNHNLAALAVCCCLLPLSGCAATASSAGGMLGKLTGRKTPEEVLNIKTPQDRAKELAKLAKDAPSMTPEEQNRVCAELAAEIRDEEDAGMRRRILRALSAFPTPLAVSILTAGLHDSNMETRRVACESLSKQGGQHAVRELTRVAQSDTEMDVRIAAVRALGETHDQTALTPLVDALADPDPAIQFRAQEGLRAVSGHDYGNNVQAWREYAQTGKSNADEIGIADRLRRRFF